MRPHNPPSSKTSRVKRWFSDKVHKATRMIPCLGISSSASINKPTKKSPVKKLSSTSKLPLRSKRPSTFLKRLDIFCWGPKLRSEPQLKRETGSKRSKQSQRSQRSPSNTSIELHKKQKKVIKAKVEKKVNKSTRKQQMKSLVLKIETNFLTCIPPTAIDYPVEMEWTPITVDPFGSPKVYQSKSGRLRGPDSKWATADFDASQTHQYTISDPREHEQVIEQYHEVKKAIADASAGEDEDEEMEEAENHIPAVDIMETEAVSNNTTALSQLPSPQPPTIPPLPNITVTDTSIASASASTTITTPAVTPALVSQPVNSTNTFVVASAPPPNSSRGCQRRATTPAVTATAATPPPSSASSLPVPQNNGTDTITVATNPPSTSSRGCQPKSSPTHTAPTRKPLAPPPGARRAVPMNFIIGESKSTLLDGARIDNTFAQPPSRPKTPVAPSAPANPLNEDVSVVAAQTPLPSSPPPQTTLRLKLHTDAKKIENKQETAQQPVIPSSKWQPKTWDRSIEDIKNCGTWKKQTCPAEWKNNQKESLTAGNGEYDEDLKRADKLLSNVGDRAKDAATIKKLVGSVVDCCMGRDNIEVPIEVPRNAISIPKIAEATPGSVVIPFNPPKAQNISQKKKDSFEDDMIKLQHHQPKAWEWLIGFLIQKGCTLQKLLVTETEVVNNGETIIEEDPDIYHDIVGKSQWSIDWRRVDDLAAQTKHSIHINSEKFYEATDLVGVARQDLSIVLRMIESEGYFETFADQVKQWALCNKHEFFRIVRKAGLCLEPELEDMLTVKKWLWGVAGDQHESFFVNMEICIQFRYPHWYERYGEDDVESDNE